MKQENIYQGTPDHMSDGHVCLTDKDCILPNEYTPKAGKHGRIYGPLGTGCFSETGLDPKIRSWTDFFRDPVRWASSEILVQGPFWSVTERPCIPDRENLNVEYLRIVWWNWGLKKMTRQEIENFKKEQFQHYYEDSGTILHFFRGTKWFYNFFLNFDSKRYTLECAPKNDKVSWWHLTKEKIYFERSIFGKNIILYHRLSQIFNSIQNHKTFGHESSVFITLCDFCWSSLWKYTWLDEILRNMCEVSL